MNYHCSFAVGIYRICIIIIVLQCYLKSMYYHSCFALDLYRIYIIAVVFLLAFVMKIYYYWVLQCDFIEYVLSLLFFRRIL